MGLEGWAPESYVTAGFKDFLEGFKENWIGDVTVTELVPLVLRVYDLIIAGYVPQFPYL